MYVRAVKQSKQQATVFPSMSLLLLSTFSRVLTYEYPSSLSLSCLCPVCHIFLLFFLLFFPFFPFFFLFFFFSSSTRSATGVQPDKKRTTTWPLSAELLLFMPFRGSAGVLFSSTLWPNAVLVAVTVLQLLCSLYSRVEYPTLP